MGKLYRPRCRCTLILPTLGSTAQKRAQTETDESFELDVNVHKASLTLNDHNQADELEIEIPYQQAGVDPRFLKNACVRFYMGDMGDIGEERVTRTKLRFAGIAVEPERTLDEREKTVRIKFHDYTSLFLRSKPFPAAGIPAFSSTLRAAWEQICDHTGYFDLDEGKIVSSVGGMRKRLVFEGNASPDTLLSKAVQDTRLAAGGKVNPGLNKNAWDVWQHVVGMCGLISFVRGLDVVVTDAAALYTSDASPVFVWGKNIAKLTEKVDTNAGGKFICLTSVNPVTGGVTEAFWPPRGKKTGLEKQKKAAAHTTKKPQADEGLTPVSDYEIHPYPYGVTDQATLTDCARRVYEERSRQELTGELTTHEMDVETSVSNHFDILSLQSGDVIQVRLDPDSARDMSKMSQGEAAAYLRTVNAYEPGVAKLLAANMHGLGSLAPNFMVRAVHTTLSFESDGGTFEVRITFCNRIQEDGGAR